MFKDVQRKTHGVFGRVMAFLLAFVMMMTLMPALGGLTEVKAAEPTVWRYEDDGVGGLPSEWGVNSPAEVELTMANNRKATFEESIFSDGTNAAAGKKGLDIYNQTALAKCLVFTPTTSGTFEFFGVRQSSNTGAALKICSVSEDKTATVGDLKEETGAGRDTTDIKPFSYDATAGQSFALYTNNSGYMLVAIRFTPTIESKIAVESVSNGSVKAYYTVNGVETEIGENDTVKQGTVVTLKATADEGYGLKSVVVKDANNNNIEVTNNTFTMPDSDVTVTPEFDSSTFGVTVTQSSNGTVAEITDKFAAGTKVTLTITPDAGYVVDEINVTNDTTGEKVTVNADKSFTMPFADVTVTVTFRVRSTEPTVKTWKSTDSTTAEGFENLGANPSNSYAASGYSTGLKMDAGGVLKFTVTEDKYATVTVGILGNGSSYTPASLGIATDVTVANKKYTGTPTYVQDPSDSTKILTVTATKSFSKDTVPQEFTFSGYFEAGTYYLVRETGKQPVLYYVTIKEYEDPSDIPVVEEAPKVTVAGTITSEFDLTGATITLTGNTVGEGTITKNGDGTYAYSIADVASGDSYTVAVKSDSLSQAKKYIDAYSVSSIDVGEASISNADFTITYKDITSTWDFTLGKYEVATIQKASGTYKGLVIDATDTATYSDPKFAVQSNRVQVNPAVKITIPVEDYAPGTVTVTFSGDASFTLGTSSNTSATYSFDADTRTVDLITTGSKSAYLTKIELTKSTEPTDPTDPTDPTEPTDPTDPTEPTDPTDPTEPTDPTDPTEPTDPTDPTNPTVPEQPTEPVKPVDPEKVNAFVDRLYNLGLGREGDEEGVESWSSQLATGAISGVNVGYGVVFSEECQGREELANDNDAWVEMLYETFLGRQTDKEERAAWVSQLDAGVSREKVFQGFAESPEFTMICEDCGIVRGSVSEVGPLSEALGAYRNQNADLTKFVSRFYDETLDRKYDVEGLEGWCKSAITGANTPKQIAQQFIFSEEFTQKELSNRDYVVMLYHTFMDREPDEEGLAAWVEVLDSGREDRAKVMEGFSDSIEFDGILKGFGLN